MEITDVIHKDTIEAFEVFNKTVELANKKTLSVAIKNICKELEEKYFYFESSEKKRHFVKEFESVKKRINDECKVILSDWFQDYVLSD
tara:strand:- start:754 stop:1017 length:264 start_codon:yes stop_codon:yes gene_type:complete